MQFKIVRTPIADEERVRVPLEALESPELSFEALGLLIYLCSLQPDQRVTIDDLVRENAGRDKVYRLLRELRAAQFISDDFRVKSRQHSKPPTRGYVYLIFAPAPVALYKIGCTKNLSERMKAFRSALPFEIEVVCSVASDDMEKLESYLHVRFADRRVKGEWFALTPADVEYIKGLAE